MEAETPAPAIEATVEDISSPIDSTLSFTLSPGEKTAEVPKQHHSAEQPVNEVEFSMTDLAPDSFDDLANDSPSLSPVIYPQRPPKGRKSLASVELPNFNKPTGQ